MAIAGEQPAGQGETGPAPALPMGGLGSGSPVLARPRPTPRPRIELCPYCGRESVNTTRCSTCGGYFDALSKQATQNAMGPWWLREGERPTKPGCSYDTIRSMVARGSITTETVLRGPTTRQFWLRARRVPGVAHLLGVCHSCQREVATDAFMCAACGASFNTETDRQHLGLSPVSLLPGQAGAERIAAVSAASVPIPIPGTAIDGSGADVGEAAGSPAGAAAAGYSRPADDAWARARLAGVRLSPAAMASASGVGPGAGEGAAAGAGRDLETETSDGTSRSDRPRRRGGSLAGAVGMMMLGAIVAAAGIWVALVQSQGGVQGALVALGVGEAGPGGGGVGPTLASRDGSGPASPGEGGLERPDDPGTPIAGESGVPRHPTTIAAPPEPEAPEERSPAGDPPGAAMLARLSAEIERGDWGEAARLVDDLGRSGVLGVGDAAAWRAALEARGERSALGGLP